MVDNSKQQEEFSQIYDKYIDKIYRFIFLKVNSKETAEDLSSEAFTRCWRKLQDNQGNSSAIENPQAFLYQIARNLVVDHYREKGKAQFISADFVPVIDPKGDIKEKIELSSDLSMVRTALAGLKNEHQELVIWHYLDDLSIAEMSKILNKSEGTIRVALHRAMKSLKKELEHREA
jgi:RNA polymerase sigma-70 factor, ECF subfamily